MKRAKLKGLKRNAAVVLGNIGTMEDLSLLEQALGDPEPTARARRVGTRKDRR
jgi:epoxyqueuosine reductase